MGKTRDLFKKIRDTKGNFHPKNGHKKGLNDPDNHDGNLKKVNFHFNPKERQCQRMFQLLHNCAHFTC